MDYAPRIPLRWAHRLWLLGALALALVATAVVAQMPAEEVLRAYPAPAESLEEVTLSLRAQYAARKDVKVVSDARLNQLLIMAPAAVHAEIAQTLAKPLTPARRPAPAQPVEGATASVTLRHTLTNTTPLELERSLASATQGVLRFTRSETTGVDMADLPAAGGRFVSLKLDLANRTVELAGEKQIAQGWLSVVKSFDQRATPQATARLVSVERTEPDRMARAVALLRSVAQATDHARRQHIGQFVGMVFQPPAGEARPPAEAPPAQEAPEQPAAPGAAPDGDDLGAGPLGNVQIEFLDGLDVIIIRGKKADVERVSKIIQEIEDRSRETQPEIEIQHLQYVESEALANLLATVYDQVFAGRQGRVTYTPLVKPNALLLIGRKEAMGPLKDLIDKLDRPAPPSSLMRVIPLKFIGATTAETMLRTFFTRQPPNDNTQLGGLGTRVVVVADSRLNALIVRAGPRDFEEVDRLIQQIDVESPASKDQVRIFKLRNSLADDLSSVLNAAITGQRPSGTNQNQFPPQGGQGGAAAASGARGRALELINVLGNGSGKQLLESGVLSDISIVSDPRGNSLVVTAPPKSMPLIAELIRQLDDLPASESQIKVFTIVNGDATSLATMLQQLFGQAQQQQQAQAAALFGLNSGGGDSTLVPLRFSVDQRTNSIIASGSAGDLSVVHRILTRLDEGDIRERVTKVYRLQNAPAADVSNAINQWLQGRRQLAQVEAQTTSPFEQIEREVIVVPEPVSNSLIVSATPRYFTEVQKIVDDLDRRPPMVAIQVLIAEVTLTNTDEFGVELGVQDGSLFTRGIGTVGYPFNQAGIGNSTSTDSLATRNDVGTQGLSNFNVGRTNTTQQFGGLVLTASSQSVNVLVRALQASGRLQVISRPQVQTLDNQPAFVQVGARVPYVTSQSLTTAGTTSSITFTNVGVLLGVTPRTSPDGLIVMEINAEKSELGPEATGVPISVTAAGTVRAPQILITTAQTTVSARSGQTVILGGLITKNRDANTRRVPYLGDIPVVGRLFRYDSIVQKRTELLIIMTPHVSRKDSDVDALNQRESERMSWCLSDVVNIHGDVGLGSGANPWEESTSPLIYPDESPNGAETLPPGTQPRTTTTPDVYPPPPTREDPPPSRFQPPQLAPPGAPPGVETRNMPPPGTEPAAYRGPAAGGPGVTPIRDGTASNQPQRTAAPNLVQPPTAPPAQAVYGPQPGPYGPQPTAPPPYGPPPGVVPASYSPR